MPDKRKRTIAYYNYWLKTQLSQAGEKITSIGTESDYFISNLKLALQRGESIVPGATVTYDPPPSLENLHKYNNNKYGDRMIDLVAMNQALLDPQSLWGKSYQFTGFWQSEQLNDDWQPPGELVTFLTEGKPLVVITMGSMVMFDVKELVQKIIAALDLSGQRGIFISGWSGLASINSQSGLFYCIREIPYDWLFPQVSCVIHHGGVGTTAAVLKAGKPSIILPQIICQADMGKILRQANLATEVLDTSFFNPQILADAITQALVDPSVQQSTKTWKMKITSEHGVSAAANLIEAHWQQFN